MALKSVTVTIERKFILDEEPYDELTKGLSNTEIINLVAEHFHEDLSDLYRTTRLDWLPSVEIKTEEMEENE